jgi:hypothetical protein
MRGKCPTDARRCSLLAPALMNFSGTLDSQYLRQSLSSYYSQGVLGGSLGCDVDFVQGTDSFHFGVWLQRTS